MALFRNSVMSMLFLEGSKGVLSIFHTSQNFIDLQ